MESLEGTLTERVEAHISIHHPAEPEWGSPHVTTTPLSLRVENLVGEVAHLEEAVREIAREVQTLSRELEAVTRDTSGDSELAARVEALENTLPEIAKEGHKLPSEGESDSSSV